MSEINSDDDADVLVNSSYNFATAGEVLVARAAVLVVHVTVVVAAPSPGQ